MKINAIKLHIATENGAYGFAYILNDALTIIRGNNSSGKSLIFNSILYAFGAEQLLGGIGPSTLPYAAKEYLYEGSKKIHIDSAEVIIEIENKHKTTNTFRRSVVHPIKNHKLVEVYQCALLTKKEPPLLPINTFLHDGGAASTDAGFHHYLENFLDIKLPNVPSSDGNTVKLYIQTLFAAFAIEQKRGWSDYIANIPFYGIRDVRQRVVEFLLGFDTFENHIALAQLNSDASQIFDQWRNTFTNLTTESSHKGITLSGITNKPDPLFDVNTVSAVCAHNNTFVSIPEAISLLYDEHRRINNLQPASMSSNSNSILSEIKKETEELHEIQENHIALKLQHNILKTALAEYLEILNETSEDLLKNKQALKLRSLGAQLNLNIAKNTCPTCHQKITDYITDSHLDISPMTIEENITHLESQKRMIEKQIAGTNAAITEITPLISDADRKIKDKSRVCAALRSDLGSCMTESKGIALKLIQIENRITDLQGFSENLNASCNAFKNLSARFIENQAKRKSIPKDLHSGTDQSKISTFERYFKSNAKEFGYSSANIEDITINRPALIPLLQHIELREVINSTKTHTNVKADSSASDFVRLIWSYIIAIYQTSAAYPETSNHPQIILLDEPAQHSMSEESLRSLLVSLSSFSNIQTIVAASFDQSDSIFKKATSGVPCTIINIPDKSITKFP